jgi:Transglutaminase-like superfamily
MTRRLDVATLSRPLSPGAKLTLAGEVLGAYVEVRRTLRRRNLPDALRELRGPPAPAQPAAQRTQTEIAGARLGAAVSRTLRLLPTDSRCLMRSLVLTALLSRRGLDSRLVLAVQPGERLGAHAWVELGGRPLLPPGGSGYERLAAL